MNSLLRLLGWASIILGFILGIYFGIKPNPIAEFLGVNNSFKLNITLFWWIGSGLLAVIFFTLSYILDYVEAIFFLLRDQTKQHEKQQLTYPEKGKTNAMNQLSRLQDFKMKHPD